MTAKPKLDTMATSKRVIGDAVYNVELHVDMSALLRHLAKRAAWSKSGRATACGGTVVVTAKQANVAGRE